jgi:hypothetical protein
MKHAPISVPNAKRQLLGTCRSLISAIAARNFQNFWIKIQQVLANEERDALAQKSEQLTKRGTNNTRRIG